MKRIIFSLIAVLALIAVTVTYETTDSEPVEAASSIYGIHVLRGDTQQAFISGSPIRLPAGTTWDDRIDDAAAIISNASPYVDVAFGSCASAYACYFPRLAALGTSAPLDDVIYDLAFDHLEIYGLSGTHRQDVRINSSRGPYSEAVKRFIACDLIMRTLGVADGCKLDGWPTENGLAILKYMHTHIH